MMTMKERKNMDPLPKHGQTWSTKHGHLVRILLSMRPGPQQIIETAYVDGRVDGHLGANFHLDGSAVLGADALQERVN